jgi:hypothetical protein
LILTGRRSVANIFDATAIGRVTPAGEFHDHEAVHEYFFASSRRGTSRALRYRDRTDASIANDERRSADERAT